MTSQRSPQKVNRGDHTTISQLSHTATNESKNKSFLLDLCQKIQSSNYESPPLNELMKIIEEQDKSKSFIMEILQTVKSVHRDVCIDYIKCNNLSGRPIRSGNCRLRVIPVILWKQYSGREFFGFFPMISGQFLPESTGIHRKKSRQFPAGILLPYSSDFRYFLVGSGGRNHRPGLKTVF